MGGMDRGALARSSSLPSVLVVVPLRSTWCDTVRHHYKPNRQADRQPASQSFPRTHVEGGELEEGEEEVVERVVVRGEDARGVHLLQGRVELTHVEDLRRGWVMVMRVMRGGGRGVEVGGWKAARAGSLIGRDGWKGRGEKDGDKACLRTQTQRERDRQTARQRERATGKRTREMPRSAMSSRDVTLSLSARRLSYPPFFRRARR